MTDILTSAQVIDLQEEIAFWRGDLAARLCFAVGLHRHAVANGDEARASDIAVNSIMPWLASLKSADAKEWHDRCDACGEFVRPDQPRAGSSDISGHASCLVDDPSGWKPEGTAWQEKAIADAKAIVERRS